MSDASPETLFRTTQPEDHQVKQPESAAVESQPLSLPIELVVKDAETIAALWKYEEGPKRDQFAQEALKLGVLALRQASGVIDASLIKNEATSWLKDIQSTLDAHATLTQDRLNGTLKEYFDPESGRFNERIQRLISDDGELQKVLASHIEGEDSQLSKTLIQHVGEKSALMKVLNPDESEGILSALKATLEEELTEQRTKILKEFSLDHEDGALKRLVRELTKKHGELSEGLQGKIDSVVKEFSLDDENSSLSRLVRNVDRAQKTISSEFSLDNDTSALSRLKDMLESTQGVIHKSLTLDDDASPLSRMRRELHSVLESQEKKNQTFQEEVKIALAKIVATREEASRGTQHGNVFEEVVNEFIVRHAQQSGDIAMPCGTTTGLIKHCKVGDCVIELGSDSAAPGTKIVIEAKEDQSYTQKKAIDELEIARKNRGAAVGMFVYSSKTAPSAIAPIARHGNDVYVIWNPEDAYSDSYLTGGLLVARALCLSQGKQSQARVADFEAMTEAILEIEKKANGLDDITKRASTIKNSSEAILEIVRKSQKSFAKQIETLQEHLGDLEKSMGAEGAK